MGASLIFLLVVTVFGITQILGCGLSGKVYNEGGIYKCFWFNLESATRNDANTICGGYGGTLATIDNQDVSTFVENSFSAFYSGFTYFWVGTKLEGGTWTSWKGEPVTWTNWLGGQPKSDECLQVKIQNFGWFTWCTGATQSLCEIDYSKVSKNSSSTLSITNHPSSTETVLDTETKRVQYTTSIKSDSIFATEDKAASTHTPQVFSSKNEASVNSYYSLQEVIASGNIYSTRQLPLETITPSSVPKGESVSMKTEDLESSTYPISLFDLVIQTSGTTINSYVASKLLQMTESTVEESSQSMTHAFVTTESLQMLEWTAGTYQPVTSYTSAPVSQIDDRTELLPAASTIVRISQDPDETGTQQLVTSENCTVKTMTTTSISKITNISLPTSAFDNITQISDDKKFVECRCVPRPTLYNYTPTYREEIFEMTVKELYVPYFSTKKYNRRLKTAYDMRTSSNAIGGLIMLLCFIAFTALFFSDVRNAWRILIQRYRKSKRRRSIRNQPVATECRSQAGIEQRQDTFKRFIRANP